MFPGFKSEDLERMEKAFAEWFGRFRFNYDEFSKERWRLHRAHPSVTLDEYRCRVLHRFGQIVSSKLIVYLDLNYWINLRKVVLGQQAERAYVELYAVLLDAAERGALVCPLSFWVFEELLKQTDPVTRKATAALVDKMSNGVAFVAQPEIVSQELLHFIRKTTPRYAAVEQWPIHECIWTRTISFVGDRIPVPTAFSKADQLLIQKNWEDFYFFIPFEELFDRCNDTLPNLQPILYDVDDINRRKQQVRLEHRTFENLFLAELMHTIKENESQWYETMAYLYHLESGVEESINADTLSEAEKQPARNLLWWLFKEKRISDELPSYHIPAGLYAAACWDTARKTTKNDILDFYHAQLAIPYCDFFLTDAYLKTLTCSKHLQFDKVYRTTILSEPNGACVALRERLQQPATCTPSILQELFQADTYASARDG